MAVTTKSTSARKATGARKAPARSRAGNRSVVTGVNFAFVNCADGIVRQIEEGESVPSDTPKEELDRLAAAGVFGEHPRVEHRRHMERLRLMGLASNLPDVDRSDEELLADQDLVGGDNSPAIPDVEVPPLSPEQASVARAAAMGDDAGSAG